MCRHCAVLHWHLLPQRPMQCRRMRVRPARTASPATSAFRSSPYGRWFKLSGYTIGVRQTIPLAMMAQIGRTSIGNNDDGTGTGTVVTARNNLPALNGVSVFLAGKATDNIGGFAQYTYSQNYSTDGTSVGHSGIDNTDIRWIGRILGSSNANAAADAGADPDSVKFLYGMTLHNNPTVQDVWNSTPAFGFPFTASPTAVGPAAGTQIEGALAQQVAGIGVYGFYDRTGGMASTAYQTADGASRSCATARTRRRRVASRGCRATTPTHASRTTRNGGPTR